MADEFTVDEIAEFKEAFGLFEKEGDDIISTKDLGAVLRSMGHKPTEIELTSMINEVDFKGRGVIDFPDFLGLMAKRIYKEDNSGDISEAFRVFDKDGGGFISVAEVRHVMNALGEPVNDEILEEELRKAEADNVGKVNYDELVKTLSLE